MSKFDVLIVGNYNVGNFGDDLLLQSCLENLKGKSIKVLSPTNSDFLTFPAGLRSAFNMRRFIDPFRAINHCSTVLFGGGGLFNSDRFYSFVIWMPILLLALLFRKKVYLFGHSFSSKPGPVFSFILKQVDFITVRDCRSYDYLYSAGIRNLKLAKDLALELEFPVIKSLKPKYLLINYRTYKNIGLEKIKNIDNLLSLKANQLGLKKLYCAFDSNLDAQLFKELNQEFILASDLGNYLSEIKYFACMRLHACLYMLKHDIPGVALSYASKVKGLLNSYVFKNVLDLQLDTKIKLEDIIFEDENINFSEISSNPWEIVE
tara:strand:- start:2104 stop:3060 length:957 start_codon:yes stop_codon:yes gene_type:complete